MTLLHTSSTSEPGVLFNRIKGAKFETAGKIAPIVNQNEISAPLTPAMTPPLVGAGYMVTDEPLGTIKSIRIITIGAGASGINMAQKVKKYLKNAEHVVYEKNPGIGGTWYENRYPGCKCDIRK